MKKSLTVFDGGLYAAVWEPDADKAGHVYRHAGGQWWIDCGSPDKANAIASLAVYNGRLYKGWRRAGTGQVPVLRFR